MTVKQQKFFVAGSSSGAAAGSSETLPLVHSHPAHTKDSQSTSLAFNRPKLSNIICPMMEDSPGIIQPVPYRILNLNFRSLAAKLAHHCDGRGILIQKF